MRFCTSPQTSMREPLAGNLKMGNLFRFVFAGRSVLCILLVGCAQKPHRVSPPALPPLQSATPATHASSVVSMPLPPPALVAPPDASVFTNYPRTIQFQWQSVPGAVAYAVEIDCFLCCSDTKWCSDVQSSGYVVPNLREPRYTFDFWGNQPGRWRVWAVDEHGQ